MNRSSKRGVRLLFRSITYGSWKSTNMHFSRAIRTSGSIVYHSGSTYSYSSQRDGIPTCVRIPGFLASHARASKQASNSVLFFGMRSNPLEMMQSLLHLHQNTLLETQTTRQNASLVEKERWQNHRRFCATDDICGMAQFLIRVQCGPEVHVHDHEVTRFHVPNGEISQKIHREIAFLRVLRPHEVEKQD